MKLGLEGVDYLIFAVYFLIVAAYGYWVYRHKGKKTEDAKDFSWLKAALGFTCLVLTIYTLFW